MVIGPATRRLTRYSKQGWLHLGRSYPSLFPLRWCWRFPLPFSGVVDSVSHHISCIPSYAGHPSLLHSLLYLFIFLGGHIPGHPLLAFLADVCRSPWPTDCNSHCGLTAAMCFVAASHQCGPSPQLPPPISYMLS